MATSPPAIDIVGPGLGQPAEYAFNITPNDDAELKWITRALRIGTGGDVALQTATGAICIVPDVLSGETLVIRTKKVYATSTTATGIVGLA